MQTTPPPPPSGAPSLTAPSRGPAGSGSPNLTAPSRGGPVLPGTPNLAAPSRGNGTQATTTESYTYDADGQRVTRTAGGITTVYIGGMFEQDIQGGVLRSQYTLNGRVIAQRTQQGASTTLVYLHGDHLGSVSVATSSTGAVLDRQEYGPWGAIRSGGVSETTLNYTGQQRDGTGLLYYGARYYDPALGRFLSPDSIGVDFTNPQSLNRYAYVGNNPVNHTDPTGHCRPDECDFEPGGENYQSERDGRNDTGDDTDPSRDVESVNALENGTSGGALTALVECLNSVACTAGSAIGAACAVLCRGSGSLPNNGNGAYTVPNILNSTSGQFGVLPADPRIVRPNGSHPAYDPVTGLPPGVPSGFTGPLNPDDYNVNVLVPPDAYNAQSNAGLPLPDGTQFRIGRPYFNLPELEYDQNTGKFIVGEKLPDVTETGQRIGYTEYDVTPKQLGQTRNDQRVVIGVDQNGNQSGRYYTNDHYTHFTPFEY